jgi:SSS family solute:Na+ symporter
VAFNRVLPQLMLTLYGPALLAVGAAALMAGLMAGLAGNVSGFSALWTEEIYRGRLSPGRSERHYIAAGRLAALGCVLLALLGAWATFHFRDLMEFLQMIVALFYAPMFAIVLTSAVSRNLRSPAAMAGIVGGVLAGLGLQTSYWMSWVRFGSQMSADFYTALLSFFLALAISTAGALAGRRARPSGVGGEMPLQGMRRAIQPSGSLAVWSALLLLSCVLLSFWWR